MLDDLSAFFGLADFAVQATRTRLLAADVTFACIVGEADAEALESRAIAPLRQIAYATGPDVIDGDSLTLADPSGRFTGTYRVRRPERVNDGAESRALLQLIG